MKIVFRYFILMLIFTSLILAQEQEEKTPIKNSISGIESTQAVEGDVIFTDGPNQLLRITDEGSFGAIQMPSGVPSTTTNKLYNDGGSLKFDGNSLGGGANSLSDLSDATNDGSNVYLGDGTGNGNSGAANTGLGHNALSLNTTGTNNTAVGWVALNKNTIGNFNTAIGLAALADNTSGALNTALGNNSLSRNTIGGNNLAIGYGADSYNEEGSNNTMIGFQAGFVGALHNKSGNVFLGYNAGYFEISDNKLYIENSNSSSPLIWGDFENDSVKVNGRAHITTSLSVGSGSKAVMTNSLAVGNNTEAHGLTSIAVGEENLAWGFHSSAFGLGIRAMSYVTTAIGRYNVGDALNSQTNWNDADVLFEIGNGADNSNRSNAVTVLKNGNVGFGPSAPTASFHVDAVNGIVFDGATTGSIPVEGSGSRMMWYQGKSAFRAGTAGPNNAWDDVNIGDYSTALNYRTIASGNSSFASGYQSEASGLRSTAMGSDTKASGLHSTAIGSSVEATGDFSTGIGRYVRASGNGTIFIGDNSATTIQQASSDNRFAARFANGYRFYTSSEVSGIGASGVLMNAGDNAWSSISDSTKKENFKSVDGEEVLNKISKFNLRSWNYKRQDPSKFRHYGPMAQEFFNAFGNDGIGTIGNDTTIASADFDGINFIAIQALEKRSNEQEASIKNQVSSIKNLEARIKELEDQNQELAKINAEIRTENAEIINQSLELFKNIAQIKEAVQTIKSQNKNVKMALFK